MAYDEGLAQRLRDALVEERGVTEKRMFGGLCLLVDERMCLGIVGEELMVRVGLPRHAEALQRPGARPMDFTGKPMKGFVFVSPEGFESERALEEWVQLGVASAREKAVEGRAPRGRGAAARRAATRKGTKAPRPGGKPARKGKRRSP